MAQMKWISIKDKMPADRQSVIAYKPTAKFNNVLCCRVEYVKHAWTKTVSAYWRINGASGCVAHGITHWMPEPLAPNKTRDSAEKA